MIHFSPCLLADLHARSSRSVLPLGIAPTAPIAILRYLRTAGSKLVWLLGVTMSSQNVRLPREQDLPEKDAFARAARRAPRARRAALPMLITTSVLGGCAGHGAPSFVLVGAFFPAWMFCAFIGIFGAIAARSVFVASGLDSVLPFQFFVSISIGVVVGTLTWLIWFGQ